MFTKNQFCYSDTTELNLKVKQPTKINSSPASNAICEGSSFLLTANYLAEPPVNFEWFKDNNILSSENNDTLNFLNAETNISGIYKMKIIGNCGAETSEEATINILPKPQITNQPKDKIVCEGGNTNFKITASGSGTIHYQWFINENPIGDDGNELILENILISKNNSKISCKVSSDCQPAIFSDTVTLFVDDIPPTPGINAQIGFCKSSSLSLLIAEKLTNHTLNWFDADRNQLVNNQIDINTINTRNYFVSQVDSNGCQSLLKPFLVVVSEPFKISATSDKNALCSSGHFNRIGQISTTVVASSLVIDAYTLKKGNITLSENQSGDFEISSGGNYRILGEKAYCADSVDLNIPSIFPELISTPNTSSIEICKNSNISLSVSGSFSGGKYIWWESADLPFQIGEGENFEVANVQNPISYFASFSKTQGDIFCESERAESHISIKEPLKMTFVISPVSCNGLSNGSVVISPKSGKAPITFILNGTETNQTGIFNNLSPGPYSVQIIDADGCKGDSLFNIITSIGPSITSQPVNITRCKGNTANFSVLAGNFDQIIWERKLPSETTFSIISDATSSTLALSNIGNTINPHLTIYRAKVTKGSCSIYSNEATLSVNSITGSGTSITVCENNSANFVLDNFTIVGTVQSYQWQYRPSTSGIFSDLTGKTSSNLSIDNVRRIDDGYYRSKMVFDNGGGNTCIINTSTTGTKLTVDTLQIPILGSKKSICLGQSVFLSATNCNGILTWSDGQKGLTISVSPTVTTEYTAVCVSGTCSSISTNSLLVEVQLTPLGPPSISTTKLNYCVGETIAITATNCIGTINWSNGMSGNSLSILSENSISISATCNSNDCQSPESNLLNIKVLPILTAGQIASNSEVNCAGFNPSTINNISSPSGGSIQWQKSENCQTSSFEWEDISGENSLTYNPPALSTTTCFRRMVSDSCNSGVFSNVTIFEIKPDPVISIVAEADSVCFGNALNLSKILIGGEGICPIQWQVNKVSGAVSSSFWINITSADTLSITNSNIGQDSTFYFRAKVDCSNSSCNQATSNVVSAVFHPKLEIEVPFIDSTICAGSQISILSTGCKGNIVWSTGENSAHINISPSENINLKVSCHNSCDTVSKNVSINVVPGIGAPVSNTPENVIEPNTLKFSAIGQNLKWYSSQNSTEELGTTPEITSPGTYTFWVSQKIGNCESVRIAITATIVKKLKLLSQVNNQINCSGNTSNFTVMAEGAGILSYQWFRKIPTEQEFALIPIDDSFAENSNTSTLKIKSVGNSSNPNLTEYWCVISDQNSEIISNAAILTVNSLKGSLINQKYCIGQNFSIDLNNTHEITGNPTKIQWQQRKGTGIEWEEMKDTLNISGTNGLLLKINNLNHENEQQYRCTFIFNSSSSTCIETTDLMTLTVGDIPQAPIISEFEMCQNSPSPKFELNEPNDIDVIWYTDKNSYNGTSTQPKISTSEPGRNVIFITYKSKESCESLKVPLFYTINSIPPKPINTTPTNVIEGENLVFTALGEQMKWYTSRTGKTYNTASPIYQKVGTYDLYVSQTNQFGCESERTYIESEILPSFGISTQPANQTNCDGNTVNFSLKIKGAVNPNYQWQFKNLLTGKFEDILAANESTFKISDAGKAPYLDSTIFRCQISNGQKTLISNEVLLRVNKIETVLNNISICENMSINAQLFNAKIVGTFETMEWQKKEGNSFNTLFTTKTRDESFSPTVSNSGEYRLRITFKNQGSSTCIRSTSNFKIDVNKNPEPINTNSFEVCQFEKIGGLINLLPKNINIFNQDSTEINENTFTSSGKQTYIVQTKSEKGCLSKWNTIYIKVNPSPIIEIEDSIYTYCRFSERNKTLKINNLNTKWFETYEELNGTDNTLLIDTQSFENQTFWASTEGQNGCYSQKAKVSFKIKECFFDSKIDSCIQASGVNLLPNEWNYFYDNMGRIFAAINPQNQNLGTVKIDFRSSISNQIIDLNQNAFYPRYFAFQSSKIISKPILMRFYFSESEIKNYENENEVLILNYSSKNIDCETINNNKEENYWVVAKSIWQNHMTEEFRFVEFETIKNGEYAFWQSKIPNAKLSANLNNQNIPSLNIETNNTASNGNFGILKSQDGKSFFQWLPKVESLNFLDLKPFQNQNFYTLIYDFGTGIKYLMNTISIENTGKEAKCIVFENPSENRNFFKIYFPEIDKSSVTITSALGQIIYPKNIVTKEDYYEIHPNSSLGSGLFIISAKNAEGNSCSTKLWIK